MSSKRILLVGCGAIGQRLAELLAVAHEVWALSRSPKTGSANFRYLVADVTQPATLNGILPENLDYLVYCLAPNEFNESVYRAVYVDGLHNILRALPQSEALKRLYFVSSTSVYGQDDGTWVDESSPTLPENFSGRVLLAAEAVAQASVHPSTIVRFSGIYGAKRRQLLAQVASGSAVLSDESRLSNRIHEDDCVGFLHHLIQQDGLIQQDLLIQPDSHGRCNLPLYLASDSEPVEMNEVLAFLASQLGVMLGHGAGSASRRQAGNKKCRNQRMLESGYQLRFPSYREGYLAMLRAAQ